MDLGPGARVEAKCRMGWDAFRTGVQTRIAEKYVSDRTALAKDCMCSSAAVGVQMNCVVSKVNQQCS